MLHALEVKLIDMLKKKHIKTWQLESLTHIVHYSI